MGVTQAYTYQENMFQTNSSSYSYSPITVCTSTTETNSLPDFHSIPQLCCIWCSLKNIQIANTILHSRYEISSSYHACQLPNIQLFNDYVKITLAYQYIIQDMLEIQHCQLSQTIYVHTVSMFGIDISQDVYRKSYLIFYITLYLFP